MQNNRDLSQFFSLRLFHRYRSGYVSTVRCRERWAWTWPHPAPKVSSRYTLLLKQPNQNLNPILRLRLHPRPLLSRSLTRRPIWYPSLPKGLDQLAQVNNKQSFLQEQSLSQAWPRHHPSLTCPAVLLPTNPKIPARTRLAVRGAHLPDSLLLQNRLLENCLALVLLFLTKQVLSYLRQLNPNNSPPSQPPNQVDLPVWDLGQLDPQDLSLPSTDPEPKLNNSIPLHRRPLKPKFVAPSAKRTSTSTTNPSNPTITTAHSVTSKCATCVDLIQLHT